MKTRRPRTFQFRNETLEPRLPLSAAPSMRGMLAERAAAVVARREAARPDHSVVFGRVNSPLRAGGFALGSGDPVLYANNVAMRGMRGRIPGVTAPGPYGPITPGIGAGFLGNQGGPINPIPTAPAANRYYGLITIRNTTQARVDFGVAASTYQGGRFQNFALPPGGSQVYYAPFGGPFQSAPSFMVSFDTVYHRNPILLADVKTAYAPDGWTPMDVSLGRPYAIVAQAGRLNVVPVG